MLVALTREKFEQIVPLIATGPQYKQLWGKPPDLLRRTLISFGGIMGSLLLGALGGGGLSLIGSLVMGTYLLWGPILWASLRNRDLRGYAYSGFWQGRVLDAFVTEELIGTEETVNKWGELTIVENRERRINLVLGDRTGFEVEVQAPLSREHKAIARGQVAQLLVVSNREDLSRIAEITEAYLPQLGLWVGKYPYLRRDLFLDMGLELGRRRPAKRNVRSAGPYRRDR